MGILDVEEPWLVWIAIGFAAIACQNTSTSRTPPGPTATAPPKPVCETDDIAGCVAWASGQLAGANQLDRENAAKILWRVCMTDPDASWRGVDTDAALSACKAATKHALTNASESEGKVIIGRAAPRLCDRGVGAACLLAGRHAISDLQPPDPLLGVRYFERGCALDDRESCELLGVMHTLGRIVAVDVVKGVGLMVKACGLGQGSACGLAARRYLMGDGLVQDYQRARELFARGCELGSPISCNGEGVIYAKGHGIAPDPQRAVQLWQRACDANDDDGCSNLADAFMDGTARQSNPTRARQIFRKLCLEKDYRVGCRSWLLHSATDPSFLAEPERALVDSKVADSCAKGDEGACSVRTLIALNASMGSGSFDLAVLERACLKEQQPSTRGLACYSLAVYFSRQRDFVRALMHMKAGCEAGLDLACEALAGLRKQ